MYRFEEQILIVDDDPNLLSGLQRLFRGHYNLVAANSGMEGLNCLKSKGPFAVIISDMRMPEMNGIQFLMEAQKVCPDTVRIMLTGNADVETAMHAVNEGKILRFLKKPCEKATLEYTIDFSIKQYRLVIAERELLEKTLKGSMQVLTDVLALINPSAFSRASRVRHWVDQLVKQLGLDMPWQYEVAALLSQLGCVAVPQNIMVKFASGEKLSDEELRLATEHPIVAQKLLSKIPRLEAVSEMIGNQLKSKKELVPDSDELPTSSVILGGLILKAALDFDALITKGESQAVAVKHLSQMAGKYHGKILEALLQIDVPNLEMKAQIVRVRELDNTMTIGSEIRTHHGVLIIGSGQQVSHSIRTILENYLEQREIDDKISVHIPVVKLACDKVPEHSLA